MKLKLLIPKVAEIKYIGPEPTWEDCTNSDRKERLVRAFNWYNYNYGKKEAKEMISDWLKSKNRLGDHKKFQKVNDSDIRITIAWLCRCELVGLKLTEQETQQIEKEIKNLLNPSIIVTTKESPEEEKITKPNIQDRLREKMSECAAELEGIFDDFVLGGCKNISEISPINTIRSMNVFPNLIGEIKSIWQKRLDELVLAQSGKEKDLAEAYSCFGKIQLRNMIKFSETVIADCDSYVQVKKVERKPRAKKKVSPETLAAKIRYQKEEPSLGLKSESPAKLVESSEVWLYDTKKRKLMYYVADSHAGKMTVKGTAIIGFDPTLSTQKTVRKPIDIIPAFAKSTKVAMRKTYKEINSTETKLSGRLTETMIIIKAHG